MPAKTNFNEWIGTEGKPRYGETILLFKYPRETKNAYQNSYAMWNWKDNVLTITAWIRHKSIVDSEKTRKAAAKKLRELFKPERHMSVIGTECLKSSGTFIVNYQFFAKLDKCPDVETMSKVIAIFYDNAIPMSKAEYERRQYTRWHGDYEDKLGGDLAELLR